MLRIGSTVWALDENCRIYRDDDGRESRSPIFRKSFVPCTIYGETGKSWLLQGNRGQLFKLDKKTLQLREGGKFGLWKRVWLTQADVDDEVFLHDHRGPISCAVLACQNGAVLRTIRNILIANGQLAGEPS